MKTDKLIETVEQETLKLDPDTYKFAKSVVADLKMLKEKQDLLSLLPFILIILNTLISLTLIRCLR